jgi:hypothetical protein
MGKTITGIGAIRIRNQMIKQEVLASCLVTEEVYNTFMFEQGLLWIKTHVFNDEQTVSVVSASPYFWNWFKNQWYIRENDFLADYVLYILRGDLRDQKFLNYCWKNLHRVDLMNVFPNGPEWDSVLNDLYKQRGQ